MRKTAIAFLIAGLPTLAVNAAENSNYVWVDTLAENSFFKDTKLDFSTRNYWKYLKEDEAQPKEVHQAWGQNFTIDYRSGYFADFIGFDATYTGVVKLGASDYFSTRALLYNDGPGADKSNAKGFSKIGQRYVKLKFNAGDIKFNAKAGWQILKNFGVLTASNRLSQNSYLGYTGTLAYQGLSLDLGYVTSSINRDSPNKIQFTTNDKRPVDYIATAALNYKSDNLTGSYSYGEADNYMRRHIIQIAYKPMTKLTLGTQLYGSYALDEYDALPTNRKDFDDHAWHYAFDAKWKEKDWSATLGIAYTQAEKEGQIGYYNRHMSKNMRGRFNSLTSAGSDYMRDGEVAITAVTDYQVTKDLIAGIQLNYGQFHYKDNTLRNGEVNVFGRWAPSDSRLKNLSVFAMFGPGWSYKNKNKTPTLDANGNSQCSPNLAGEIIIDYKFGIL